MEVEEIKKKIQLAMNSVKDVPEPFKTKAFEVILSNLLIEFSPKKPLPSTHTEKRPIEGEVSVEEKMAKLAKIANLEVNQLKDIFHFGEKEPVFIGRVDGTEAEKQAQICRFLLLASHEVYGIEWVESSFLWKTLQDYGIGSLGNLATNIAKRENEFRAMGRGKGRKYKLTEQGRQNAIESLKQLVGS